MGRNHDANRPLLLLRCYGIHSLHDAHKSADWSRGLSCAAATINFIANFFPTCVLKFAGQPFSPKSDQWWKLFARATLSLGENQPKPALGKRAKSCLLFLRQALRPLEKVIRNFYGRLHIIWLPIFGQIPGNINRLFNATAHPTVSQIRCRSIPRRSRPIWRLSARLCGRPGVSPDQRGW